MALRNTGTSCFANVLAQVLSESTVQIERKDGTKDDAFIKMLKELHTLHRETGIKIDAQPATSVCPMTDAAPETMKQLWTAAGVNVAEESDPQHALVMLLDKYTFKTTGHVEFTSCRCPTCNIPIVPNFAFDVSNIDTRLPADPQANGDVVDYLASFAECPNDKTHKTECTLGQGTHTWLLTLTRTTTSGHKVGNKSVYDNRVRFPLHLPNTNMYLRGFVVHHNLSHFTCCLRHDDGIWWMYDDSMRRPLNPLVSENEVLLNRQFGRQALMLMYEPRAADLPANPLRLRSDRG